MSKDRFVPPAQHAALTVPFPSAEEAWFWFVQAHEARMAGARCSAGQGLVARPCEPLDIMREVDRLYRNRCLLRDHLHVLVHYGRRQEAPDPQRPREGRAARIWQEAFQQIHPVLCRKGIVLPLSATIFSSPALAGFSSPAPAAFPAGASLPAAA